jgi:hypothetical protein
MTVNAGWYKLFEFGGVILPGGLIAYSLTKGYFPARGIRIYRSESPELFWLIMGCLVAFGLGWALL